MRLKLSAAAALAISLGCRAAFAHAFLIASAPAVGETLPQGPPQLVITFSESVDPNLSHIAVTNADGARVDNGPPHLEGTETRLATWLGHLSAGQYKVVWHATDTDGHKTQGKYFFQITQ